MSRGLVIAAPRTGSGKTTLTLALLRAFSRRGVRVASAKIGPDFIDPRYHEAASGRPCLTLDGWAMRPELIAGQVAQLGDSDLILVEGVMGLFDGAEHPGLGTGATAEMARRLGLPVVLVVDAAGLGQSVAALVDGFRRHDPALVVAGVVLNNVGSDRHRRILHAALAAIECRILGTLPRRSDLVRPSRHLGLVQAEETDDLEAFLDRAAAMVGEHVDLDGLLAAAGAPLMSPAAKASPPLAPPGGRIALASDAAFRFIYPHLLAGWRTAGAEILPFSPLDDQPPDPDADAIWLPGGYPELHAGRLAAADRFRNAMIAAQRRGCALHGECGGYMVLGEGMIGQDGRRHRMLGLLPLETSFADRRLHLGYRHVALLGRHLLRNVGQSFRGHEFHYCSAIREEGPPLFKDVTGDATHGLALGKVTGSWLHLIDHSGETTGPIDAPLLRVPSARHAPSDAEIRHGGDLDAAAKLHGRHDWLDLSTGINPEAYPVPELPGDLWSRLPSSDDLHRLLAVARDHYGATGSIVAAPGTQAILHALPDLFPGRSAAYVAPAYSGYRQAWGAIRAVPDLDPAVADVLIVGHPNNPDGRLYSSDSLLDAADRLARRNGLLILDEAFADPTPAVSLAAATGRPGLLVLRSFGKFFGLAGLRLGFALGDADIVARLAARLGPWAVSGPALFIAIRALADRSWITSTRAQLPRAAGRLDALLSAAGLTPIGGTPLFRLVETPDAFAVQARLARAGIWTRRFDEAPTRLRFGLPGREADWIRLETCLMSMPAA